MAIPAKIQTAGNQLVVIMDDGTRYLAYPTGGSLWYITDGASEGGTHRFIWPFDPRPIAEGGTATDEYGPRPPDPFHNGIDLAAPAGTPIPAMGNGIVTISQTWDGVTTDPSDPQSLGNYIRIRHSDVGGNVLHTGYAHAQNAPAFSIGDSIAQSEIIGLVGDTGFVFGAHLHLETWENGVRIDPRIFMATYAD